MSLAWYSKISNNKVTQKNSHWQLGSPVLLVIKQSLNKGYWWLLMAVGN